MLSIALADDPSLEHGTISLSAAIIANSVYAEKLGLQSIKTFVSPRIVSQETIKSLSQL